MAKWPLVKQKEYSEKVFSGELLHVYKDRPSPQMRAGGGMDRAPSACGNTSV